MTSGFLYPLTKIIINPDPRIFSNTVGIILATGGCIFSVIFEFSYLKKVQNKQSHSITYPFSSYLTLLKFVISYFNNF
jgi:hypothetical protein